MKSSLFPVAILAGGLATRLRPLTETIPKALVEIEGKPFIQHQLLLLERQGVCRVVICAGYLGELIEQKLAMVSCGLDIEVIHDGDRLLGTAGALRAAAHMLDDAFFVLYGDSYLTCDFLEVQTAFLRANKPALMAVFRNCDQYDRSNIEFERGRILAYDKRQRTSRMHYIDYGLGILAAESLRRIPAGEPYDLATLYADLLRSEQLAAFEVTTRFYEIGSPRGLEETRAYFGALVAEGPGT